MVMLTNGTMMTQSNVSRQRADQDNAFLDNVDEIIDNRGLQRADIIRQAAHQAAGFARIKETQR